MYSKDTTNCFSHLVGVRCKSQGHGQDFWPELKGTTAILVSREKTTNEVCGDRGSGVQIWTCEVWVSRRNPRAGIETAVGVGMRHLKLMSEEVQAGWEDEDRTGSDLAMWRSWVSLMRPFWGE